jgi:hypothetical protein
MCLKMGPQEKWPEIREKMMITIDKPWHLGVLYYYWQTQIFGDMNQSCGFHI